eukprot:CAMPEP_0174237954 /NCGR_PEP_ID=MMETSP0417-20130205/9906_1 /TAXON_ID=242541 /ORGANISM="Mayorella sp, Strain BSH-02190019" /LENGTH=197 /DNA_ID=CAMNT_0015316757 /DNA_START=11 /DNA_END=604 /DNA_ORIENTATION=+
MSEPSPHFSAIREWIKEHGIVEGFGKGAVFGAGLRFCVCFLTGVLFKRLRGRKLVQFIGINSFINAYGLGLFVAGYRFARPMLMLIRSRLQGGKPNDYDDQLGSFLPGCAAGITLYLFSPDGWAKEMVLYVLKFVIEALILKATRERFISPESTSGQVQGALACAIVIGLLFLIFHQEPLLLKGSLRRSMVFLYGEE